MFHAVPYTALCQSFVASPYDITNYAKPMARDEQHLSRTKQTNKQTTGLPRVITSLPRKVITTTEKRWRGTIKGILTIILEPGCTKFVPTVGFLKNTSVLIG